MRYLLIFAFLFLVKFDGIASCGCHLEENVKSNLDYADVVFTGKVLDRTSIRKWRDTTNVRWEYKAYAKERGFYADSFNEFKRMHYSMVLGHEYTLSVSRIFKGVISEKIIRIQTDLIDGCGFPFKVGNEYLVYGHDDAKRHLKYNQLEWYERTKGTYETNICTLTTNLEKAAGQIEELKKL